MAKYFGATDNFVLDINNKCFDAYDTLFKIHTNDEKGVLAILLAAARGRLAEKADKLKIGGTYRVGIFSNSACLIVRVKVTGKNKATVIDDRKDAAYTQYLVHKVPKSKNYPDFIITEGKVARAALVRHVFGSKSPFCGPADRVKRLEQEFDRLIDQMGEIKL
jgi:hypothetical protein